MKKIIVAALVFFVFCSPILNCAYAGKIQMQEATQSELVELEALETFSGEDVESIEGGTDDFLAAVGAVFLVLVIIAAISS